MPKKDCFIVFVILYYLAFFITQILFFVFIGIVKLFICFLKCFDYCVDNVHG